jgi:hypothetical protein
VVVVPAGELREAVHHLGRNSGAGLADQHVKEAGLVAAEGFLAEVARHELGLAEADVTVVLRGSVEDVVS